MAVNPNPPVAARPVRMLWVQKAVDDGRVALWDVDPRHPGNDRFPEGGEVYIADMVPVRVALTDAVNLKLHNIDRSAGADATGDIIELRDDEAQELVMQHRERQNQARQAQFDAVASGRAQPGVLSPEVQRALHAAGFIAVPANVAGSEGRRSAAPDDEDQDDFVPSGTEAIEDTELSRRREANPVSRNATAMPPNAHSAPPTGAHGSGSTEPTTPTRSPADAASEASGEASTTAGEASTETSEPPDDSNAAPRQPRRR